MESHKVRDKESDKVTVEHSGSGAASCYTEVTTGAAGVTFAEVREALAESLQCIDLCLRFGNPLCLQDEH